MKILLVEDDPLVAEVLKKALTEQHYVVEQGDDGLAGWELAEMVEYDLILLDIMLPKLDGISFCKRLRSGQSRANDRTPVLLLTAQDAINKRVLGLDAGADDYLVKPFHLEEVLARIRALLRRQAADRSPLLEFGPLCLNPNNCEVTCNGETLALRAKEYALLELFLRNRERIFSQRVLIERLWSFEEVPTENAVRVHLKSLRQRLKQAGVDNLIETVYGLGYRLKKPENGLHPAALPPSVAPPLAEQQTTQVQATQVTTKLNQLWERHQPQIQERLRVFDQALTSLRQGAIPEPLRVAAQHQSHSLVGSLGCLGFIEATQACRAMNTLFEGLGEGHTDLSATADHLADLLAQLHQTLQQAPTQPTPAIPPESSMIRYPHLLIVDDDVMLAERIKTAARDMQVEIIPDLDAARAVLSLRRPDIVLLDLCFPDAAETGLTLLAELNAAQPPIPVVVMTVKETFADRVEVARLGGRGFLQKPVTPQIVLDEIAQVLQQTTLPTAKLLIVDDDPQFLDGLQQILAPWGFELCLLTDSQHFWPTLEKFTPDLLILDVDMPIWSGIDLCQVVRNDSYWGDLPILLMSAHSDQATIHTVFTVGADDYVTKPIVGAELVARINNRIERAQLLRKLAEIDSLTGVRNRRRSIQDLTRLIRLTERQGQPFCFVILDIDHFKHINDTYGHAVGDQVLTKLGELLQTMFRDEDITSRWGGDEFIVGLYGIRKSDGLKRLHQFLEVFQQMKFTNHTQEFRVNLSAGVAQFPLDGTDLQTLYQAADQALYQAKSTKARVISNSFPASSPPHPRQTKSPPN